MDPDVPNSSIRLLPWVFDGEALMVACRTRLSAWVTRFRLWVRYVLCWSAFPLAPALGSTASATGSPALFGGFTATMTESDFSESCIGGYGSSPSHRGPSAQ